MKPKLVVMAAGLGSRYGGMKQVQPVGDHGQTIMEYSLYDAGRAGFDEAVFVISRAMEAEFPSALRARVGDHLRTRCVVQEIGDVPPGFQVPEGREKPWGTGHAVRACRNAVDGPFAVINADDFYGADSFRTIFSFLSEGDGASANYAMVGYELPKTLSESGYVSRGICRTDAQGMLLEIHERKHIIATQEGAMYTEDGQLYHRLPDDAVASMNIWGFSPDFMAEVDRRFTPFLDRTLRENPLKGEYYLPEVVGEMLSEGCARVRVLPCAEKWYGVTYREDLPSVVRAIRAMTEAGQYPERLWA